MKKENLLIGLVCAFVVATIANAFGYDVSNFSTVDEAECSADGEEQGLSKEDDEFIHKNWSCSCSPARLEYLLSKSDPPESESGLLTVEGARHCFTVDEKRLVVNGYMQAEAEILQAREITGPLQKYHDRLEKFAEFPWRASELVDYSRDRGDQFDVCLKRQWGPSKEIGHVCLSLGWFVDFLRAEEMVTSWSADERYLGISWLKSLEGLFPESRFETYVRQMRKDAEWLTCAQLFAGDRVHLHDDWGPMQMRLLKKHRCLMEDYDFERFSLFVGEVIEASAIRKTPKQAPGESKKYFDYAQVDYESRWILKRELVQGVDEEQYRAWVMEHIRLLAVVNERVEFNRYYRFEVVARLYDEELSTFPKAESSMRQYALALMLARGETEYARYFALTHIDDMKSPLF